MAYFERALVATAYHEAGHAVVAWWLAVRFSRVGIKPGIDSLGHVLFRHPKWFQPDVDLAGRIRLRAEHTIMVGFAGQIAEARFFGQRPQYEMGPENQNAGDMALRLHGSRETAEAYLKFCFHASQDHVSRRWPNIESVAAALLRQETLSYDETRRTIDICFPAKAARKGG